MKAQGSCGLAWGGTLGEATGQALQSREEIMKSQTGMKIHFFFFLSGGDERWRSEVSGEAEQNREVEWGWGWENVGESDLHLILRLGPKECKLLHVPSK